MFNSKENGFSVIELIVVLVITAILAQIGYVTWNLQIRKSRSFAAKTAIKNIKKECEANRDLGLDSIFTLLEPRGYGINSRDTNSCLGEIASGLISAIPNKSNEYPSYYYDFKSGDISCDYKNSKDKLFKECINLPPNKSIAFGPDSGLSCREVKVGSTHFGYSQIFTAGYFSGSQLKFLKTTFKIGEKKIIVDGLGVQSFRTKQRGRWVISRDGIKNWVAFTTKKINEQKGGYSAEIDPEDPFGIKFYLPNGKEADNIEMLVHQRPRGEWDTYVSPVLGDLNNDPKTRGWENYDPSRGIFVLNPQKDTTTVCDGRDSL